jgi:hypothetical protein
VFEEKGRFFVESAQGVRTEIQVRDRNAGWYLIEGLEEGMEVRT